MATAEKHSPDLVVPPESIESQGTLVAPAEEKSAASENQKEKIPLIRDEEKASTSGPCNAICIDLPGDKTDQMRFVDGRAHHSGVYQPNIYAPQVQTIYYGGYENPPIEWDEYPQFLNQEGMETGSHGASLMFHTGYGYSPQMPYGPYSPVTTPLSSSSRDNQMYSTQQFTFAGPYFQQPGPVTMPYLNSSAPVSQGDLTIPVGAEQQGFGGFGSGGLWSDWSKSPDGQRPLTPFSPAASPPPSGGFGTFGNSLSPFSSGMDSQQQRACGFGSSTLSYDRGYSYSSMYHQGANFGANLGMNARGWVAIDKGSWRGKASTAFCSCNGSLDLLSEQNRGPRATRPKNLATDANPTTDGKTIMSAGVVAYECNKPDFVTEYKDAKFFIIKSYSEDNVHKSIKYGVWASTPNGNKKLDLAYREAKEKEVECPVFLFFSVNASGQFCGVAEMIGPVDFERSVDYWQQDKWSGQFPVKWHIVKDAPNSLFRHIILENNGNKPVTNSRDTQEVKLEEGFKMLNIFKNHEADMSILDDFDFYEERQRAMQERKVWQQQQQQQRQPNSVVPTSAVLRNEQHNPAHLPEDLENQMPKTFAQAVRLDDKNIRGDPEVAGKGSLTTSAAKAGDLGELAATGIQSS